MPHVLVVGAIHASGKALLDAAPGYTARYITDETEAGYAGHVAEADAIVIRTQPMSAATIAAAERLRIVSRHGVGYDAVDVPALTARGIPLTICGDVNSTAVAEHAAMLILAASKRVLRADRAVREGPWSWRNGLESQDLRGRNLLQIGYGRIGRHVAAMMGGFAMTIRAYDPFLLQRGWPADGVAPIEDLHEALAWADIVSISIPRTGAPLIGTAELDLMKDGAILVNTARGGLIDEAALVAALESGRIGAAGLDVFETEPLPQDHPLTRFDQVVLSPHIAGLSEGSAERMALASVQNVLDYLEGRPLDPGLVVNGAEIADR